MMDNHQRELLLKFSDEGYITWCRDLSGLEEAIRVAALSTPKPYVLPESTIGDRIREFLGAHARVVRPAEIER
jgi:UDP-N-acetylglucosamine transferase subunit ALG13